MLESWANAEWFHNKPRVKEQIKLTVFKVDGETTTDDLSPEQDAFTQHDIPLHALSMLKNPRPGIQPDNDYKQGPVIQINDLKRLNKPVVYVGDVVGTGLNRESSINSLLWHFGNPIPFVPNKKNGGFCFAGKIAPIFFNAMEDNGALPIEMNVDKMYTGQQIEIYPYEGIVKDLSTDKIISEWKTKTNTILDSVQANGRINLIIGKKLTNKAQSAIKKFDNSIFIKNFEIKVGKTRRTKPDS